MSRATSRPLNLRFLDDRLRELGLRRWWLAERMGVDRRTVSRWLSGRTQWVQEENLAAMAKLLDCRVDDLTLADPADAHASKAEQAEAARLVARENLLELLGPAGRWPLAATLVEAVMRPGLPLPLLGALYNQLATATWRQSKLDAALKHATKAREIGERIGSKAVLAHAFANIGTILALRGDLAGGLAAYDEGLALHRYLDSPKERAGVLSNVAATWHDYGDLARAAKLQKEAIAAFLALEDPAPMNLSIAYANLARTLLEQGVRRAAEDAGIAAEAFAKNAAYERGLAWAPLFAGELAALAGRHEDARARVGEALARYAELGIEEAQNYEIAARVARLGGDLAGARRYLKRAGPLADGFGVEKALVLLERAAVEAAEGDARAAQKTRREAARVLEACGAEARRQRLTAGA